MADLISAEPIRAGTRAMYVFVARDRHVKYQKTIWDAFCSTINFDKGANFERRHRLHLAGA